MSTPLGNQRVPEIYGDTGIYTFFNPPEHVQKLDLGGKPLETCPAARSWVRRK